MPPALDFKFTFIIPTFNPSSCTQLVGFCYTRTCSSGVIFHFFVWFSPLGPSGQDMPFNFFPTPLPAWDSVGTQSTLLINKLFPHWFEMPTFIERKSDIVLTGSTMNLVASTVSYSSVWKRHLENKCLALCPEPRLNLCVFCVTTQLMFHGYFTWL